MNILILTPDYPPVYGGIGTHVFFLAQKLVEKGNDVTIIVSRILLEQNIDKKIMCTKDKNIIVASNDLKVLSKYGLEITSIDETNMTDKDLADAKALLNNKTVTYIFTKKGENESNTLKELKKKYEVKTLEIDTLNNISADSKNDNQNYITIMNQNIDNQKK